MSAAGLQSGCMDDVWAEDLDETEYRASRAARDWERTRDQLNKVCYSACLYLDALSGKLLFKNVRL